MGWDGWRALFRRSAECADAALVLRATEPPPDGTPFLPPDTPRMTTTTCADKALARRLLSGLAAFAVGRDGVAPLAGLRAEAAARGADFTDEWRQLAGPGSAGIRDDDRCYQKAAPGKRA
eukprot:gene34793-55844_t